MSDWQSKRVLIIGAGRQGLALARYLSKKGADVVVSDQRPAKELEQETVYLSEENIATVFGNHPIELLDACDLVCPSGGVPLTSPLVVEAQNRGIPLSNDSQIFLEITPCPVIGITGSSGKTTVTTLLGRMVQEAMGSDMTWIGGNIGNPLISDVDKMESDHLAVMELSSFQLEIMTTAPHVACVLNLTPNHLDRHGTMDAYTQAKARILEYQVDKDLAVLNREDPGSWALRKLVKGKLISFGRNKPDDCQAGVYIQNDSIVYYDGKSTQYLLPKRSIALRGEHNLDNVLAACALAVAGEIPVSAIAKAIEGFSGVEHRLEFVREWGGAAWFNDSIATAPERAVAAIKSFDQPVVLLAGGRDKDLPWSDFARVVRQRVDHLVLFGEAREIISEAVGPVIPGRKPYSIDLYHQLTDALRRVLVVIDPGDVVLLSPGGTSFDEFHDFTERGAFFKEWVNNLT